MEDVQKLENNLQYVRSREQVRQAKERWLTINKRKCIIANWAERADSTTRLSACLSEGQKQQKWREGRVTQWESDFCLEFIPGHKHSFDHQGHLIFITFHCVGPLHSEWELRRGGSAKVPFQPPASLVRHSCLVDTHLRTKPFILISTEHLQRSVL